MDYIRLYTALLTHPKAEGLSDRAWRVLTLAWLYAGQHETGGRVPPEAKRFIRMTPTSEAELSERGWLHRNGNGWVLHDWEDHQADADELRERREIRRAQWRESKRRKRAGEET